MSERLNVNSSEIKKGSQCAFLINNVGRSDLVYRGKVEDIKGGGFYGKALIFPDFVVKTTEPDSWHLLWRRANRLVSHRSTLFPPQAVETDAQLDHISSKLIHLAITSLTSGYITAPDSYGYTDLNSIGFSQVIERMHGRGARFDSGGRENLEFKIARQKYGI